MRGPREQGAAPAKRWVVPSAAFLWGLQFAFLNPALALLLVTVFHATATEVGGILAVYNASGFLASIALPAYADRRGDYLRPMMACAVLTLALAVLLAVAGSVPVVVVGLVVLGGPAGVGSSLLFAQLKHSGAGMSVVVRTRAFVSLAWVLGPPLATVIMGVLGSRAILVAIAVVAVLAIVTTALMLAGGSTTEVQPRTAAATPGEPRMRAVTVALVVLAFVVLQATNYTVVTVMSLFVTQRLHLDVVWAGVTLGVAAGLEIPALLLVGRLGRRHSSLALVATGCAAGIAYYVAMTFLSGPVLLIGAQLLNAWFFAVIAGVGLALFQAIIPRPGMASGLYTNTRRLGAVVSGPIIAFGSVTSLGYSGVFAVCAGLTLLSLILVAAAGRAAPGRAAAGRSATTRAASTS